MFLRDCRAVAALGIGALALAIAPCPFHALTGWACPGCGTRRAVGALVGGDVSAALGANVLAVVTVPLVAWVAWLALRRRPVPARPALWTSLTMVAVAFAVVRNLPVGAALAP